MAMRGQCGIEDACGARPLSLLNGGCAWGERREAEGRLVFRAFSVTLKPFKECLGLLNEPPLRSEACIPTQRGLLSRTGPFWEEKPLSLSGAARQAVHAPLPTAAPIRKGLHSGLSSRISRDSRLNVLRYFMSRAAAGSGQDECLLLSAELFYLHFLNSLSR
jgi:hypothetical protein